MEQSHVPSLGPRYWAGLCLASIFGANSGDFFAHDVGLGHVAGLPFLALALTAVLIVERFDTFAHQVHYWIAIVIVRTGATNFADFFSVDLRLAKVWVMLVLTIVLILGVWLSWQLLWSRRNDNGGASAPLLQADVPYWFCMFAAGTLGTVFGDYCSHDWRLGDAGASLFLSAALAVLVLLGRGRIRWSLPFYWATIAMIRAAGTVIGDFLASRNMLGLPLSTLITGILFVGLLLVWKEPSPERAAVASNP
jgi:uncharacterized membrane-anchored protein